jgi:molybdate transport system substrate-binding protein
LKLHRLLAVLVTLMIIVTACGGDDGGGGGDGGGDGASPTTATGREGDDDFVVQTAPEIEEVVVALVEGFERANSGTEIGIELLEQADLVEAVASDQRGDFVITPQPWLAEMRQKGAQDLDPKGFGRDVFVIATAKGKGDIGLNAFRDDGPRQTIACGPDTPLGNFAATVLERAKVARDAGTIETECDTVGDRLASGEATAALVYRSEVAGRDDLELRRIRKEHDVPIELRYLVFSDVAQEFAEFVSSDDGRQIREQHGYLP